MVDTGKIEALETSLQEKLQEATAKTKTPMSLDDISGIVKEVISSLTGDVTAADLKLYTELEDLATYIRHAKEEIADIKPKEISSDHIPNATDELDAVVGATEEATNKIMDECDVISEVGGECSPEANEKLVACTTRIFEACNFQDITGQRITKVVQTLKYIDGKVEALLEALGEEIGRDKPIHTKEGDEKAEAALLNGPQLPQNAIDQDEIDKMMEDF